MALIGFLCEVKFRMKKERGARITGAIHCFGQPNTIGLALPDNMELKALVKISKESAGNLHVFGCLEAHLHRLTCFFVNPNASGECLSKAFFQGAGVKGGITGQVVNHERSIIRGFRGGRLKIAKHAEEYSLPFPCGLFRPLPDSDR